MTLNSEICAVHWDVDKICHAQFSKTLFGFGNMLVSLNFGLLSVGCCSGRLDPRDIITAVCIVFVVDLVVMINARSENV